MLRIDLAAVILKQSRTKWLNLVFMIDL